MDLSTVGTDIRIHVPDYETHNVAIASLTSLKIDGGGRRDTINITSDLLMSGKNLTVIGTVINVGAHTIDTGSAAIVFQASDEQTGTATLGYLNSTGDAEIRLNGSTLICGDLSLNATSTVHPSVDASAALLLVDSTAIIEFVDATVTASGDVTALAVSVVTPAARATGFADATDDSMDAAVGFLHVSNKAYTHVTGGSSFNVTKALSLGAKSVIDASATGDARVSQYGGGAAIALVGNVTQAVVDSLVQRQGREHLLVGGFEHHGRGDIDREHRRREQELDADRRADRREQQDR